MEAVTFRFKVLVGLILGEGSIANSHLLAACSHAGVGGREADRDTQRALPTLLKRAATSP